MNSITFKTIKAEDNRLNSFMIDEDKVGDTVIAKLTFDGDEIFGKGETKDQAIADLRDSVKSHYIAKQYRAEMAINKSEGIYFFD